MRLKCTILLTAMFLLVLAGCTETIEPPQQEEPPEDKPGTVLTDFLPFATNTFSNKVNTVAAYSFVDANNPSLKVRVINHSPSKVQLIPPRFYAGTFISGNSGNSGSGGVNGAGATGAASNGASIEGHHLDTFLYKKDSRLYKVDVSNVYDPVSVQLSSESSASLICHEWDRWADDFVNPANSRYVYYVSSDCTGAVGEWHMVRLENTEFDTPIILPGNIDYMVTHIHNQQTGELIGWLVVEKINNVSTLVRYDQDFQNPQSIGIQVNEKIELFAFSPDGKLLLANENQILLYDDSFTSRTILEIINLFDNAEQKHIESFSVTGGYLYFTIKDEVNLSTRLSRILLTNLNGSLSESLQEIASVSGDIEKIEISDTYLLFSNKGSVTRITLENFSSKIFNVPAGYVLGLDQNEYIFYVINDYLFIELMNVSDNTQRLVWVINETKLAQEEFLNGHYLVGAIFEGDLYYSADAKVEALIFETGGLVNGSRNVHVLTPDQYPGMKRLGALPDNSGKKLLKRYFASGHRKGLLEGSVNSLREIFYFDADKEDSLKRITNDNVNDSVINH